MRKRNRSVRRPHGPSLMPFGRGLRKPPRWLPQMRNSPRHWDIPKTRRNIWKHSWKTGACRSLTIYVKQISSRLPQQGGHGSLLTPRRGANAILSTLVESARANKLDVYEYLKYLLAEIPGSQYLEHPEVLDQYLPWSESLPGECRLKHNHKKCLNQ